MTLISLFGLPGAGKSTVGDKLAAQYGFQHLPLGLMLKDPGILEEIGIEAEEMQRAIASGRTVTNTSIYPWLDERIRSSPMIVVDGYPRAANSAGPFATLVESLPESRSVFALLLDCPEAVTRERLKARGRADDDERIASRNEEFHRVQAPLLDRLPRRVSMIRIDASGSAAEVFADIERQLALPGGWNRN